MKIKNGHIAGRTLILAMLIIGECSLAGTSGILEGTVRDKNGNALLPGVNLVLIGTKLGTVSQTDGRFVITNIPAGTYKLSASLLGYAPYVMTNIIITADLRTRVDILLTESSLVLGAVEVNAARPPILKDVTGTVHTVGRSEMELLPVSTFADVIALQPGVTSDLHVRGGKTTETLYLVDGLPVQDVIGGGAGTDLPRSSIASMNIQTGGYEAEYGNALSGVVNIITAGGSNVHRFTLRAESDQLMTGDQTNRSAEVEAGAGGPILEDKFFYFGTVTYRHSDTRFWQDASRFFASPIESEITGFTKLQYLVTPELKLSAQLLGAVKQYRDYEFSWRFNLNGLPERERQSYRAALIGSHTLSPSLFYTVSVSQYRQQSHLGTVDKTFADTTLFQYDFFLRYVVGGKRLWWSDNEQTITTLKADGTYQYSEDHLLKAGVEYNFYSIASDVVKFEPRKNVWGKPFVNKPLLNYSSDYRYAPFSGSAYVQDKIELSREGMLFNLGLRLDFLDPTAQRPAAERVPISEDEYQTNITSYVPASAKYVLSPRIGFSAPFAEQGYMFINYGHYVQFPLFDFLYSGLNNVSLQKGVGVLVGNPDLQPEKTRAWEVSAKYAFLNAVVLSATYFDKTTFNQVDVKTFIPSLARTAGDYGFAEFVNNPYARATGMELTVMKQGEADITGSLSYTYMAAEGLSQDAQQGLEYYQWGFPAPAKLFPLSWDQRHTVKAILNLKLPLETDLSVLWNFASGRPYTFYPTYDGFTPLDSTLKFVPNNSRLSNVSTVDIKASKRFRFSEDVVLLLFVDARNVLNRRNPRWSDSSGRIGGELEDLSAWDSPRRVRIGVKAEL